MKSPMTKQKFINQWLRHFARGLSKKQRETYVDNQFIWHVFSFDLIPCRGLLTGNAARDAFDRVEKNDCISCDLFGIGVMDQLPDEWNTAAKIEGNPLEFYVVAKDFSWTYIKTHEGDLCGPYFLRLEK